ncbi:hypothetical protein H6503_00285 [Candidatus Woesearchaeota archaeon]|nr:hypothetical protein [Candidatus Woesearchaeota archaeon]
MKLRNIDAVYEKCIIDGSIQELEESDVEKAKTMLKLSKRDYVSFHKIQKIIAEDRNYSFLWKDLYEIIHQIVQGIFLLEKVKSNNHQCLYAYLCMKHKDWELDWNILETMRIVRNNIQYEGHPVSKESWNEYKLKFELYIQFLTKKLEKMILSFST